MLMSAQMMPKRVLPEYVTKIFIWALDLLASEDDNMFILVSRSYMDVLTPRENPRSRRRDDA